MQSLGSVQESRVPWLRKSLQRTMTICVARLFAGILVMVIVLLPLRTKVTEDVSQVFWEGLLVMVIVFLFPNSTCWHTPPPPLPIAVFHAISLLFWGVGGFRSCLQDTKEYLNQRGT